MTMLQRILRNCVRVGDCLEWQGARNKAGYGKLHVPGRARGVRLEYAHRMVAKDLGWPVGDQFVLHKCDNPPCCNPDHLFIGTQKDNVHDAMKKGRWVPPPTIDWPAIMRQRPHHWQVLSFDDVIEIRRRAKAGEKQDSIAADFGISSQQVSKIKLGQRWAHVR